MDQTMDAALHDFLRTKGLTSQTALDVIVGAGYDTLFGLRLALGEEDLRKDLLVQLKEHALAWRVIKGIGVGEADNAVHFQDPAARAKGEALADFLVDNAVATSGAQVQELLYVLREGGTDSLDEVRKLKARPGAVQDVLKMAIAQGVDEQVANRFAALTALTVAKTIQGGPPEVTPELKAFIERRGLPAGADAELAGFGITTLAQLRAVKQGDKAGLKSLQDQLDKSGIVAVTKQFDSIRVDDIEQEMADTGSPEAKADAEEKRQKLLKAIKQVESLRQDVEKATDSQFAGIKSEVEAQYEAVLDAVKDVSGAEFDRAAVRSAETKDSLAAMLATTISNATAVQDVLDGVDKTPRSLARMIRQQDVLCGFLISPAGAARRYSALVKLPDNPEDLARDPGMQRSITHTYEGSEESSFAANSARNASSTLATSSQGSAAGFVGSGILAVSAAGSYANASMGSADKKAFVSGTSSECGEIHYIYAPKQVVQFNRRDIKLSDDAKQDLADIEDLPDEQRSDKVLRFFDEYGSHLFMQCSLGGRYQFTATGRATSTIETGQLVTAVAETTNWAASASASYSGIGGAAKAGSSVKGAQSVASAQGDRFALDFQDHSVDVTVEVLGGAGLAPRDVWGQSLQYSSTWAVIDRDRPLAVWELLASDDSLAKSVGGLGALLERVWVQQVFLTAVARTQPALYAKLLERPKPSTCAALDSVMAQCLSGTAEPPFRIRVVTETSASSGGPTARAALTGKSATDYKLIGGGAHISAPGGSDPDSNYLYASFPDDEAWVVQSMDHNSTVCSATATAYAIYLYDPQDEWEVKRVAVPAPNPSNWTEATAELPEGFALTGGGARVEWSDPREDRRLFLTGCHPVELGKDRWGWRASARNAWIPAQGTATAFVLGVRPKSGVPVSPSVMWSVTAKGAPPQAAGAWRSEDIVIGGGAWAQVGSETTVGLLTSTGMGENKTQWRSRIFTYPTGTAIDVESTFWVFCRPGQLLDHS